MDTEAYEPPGVGQDTGPKKAKSDIPDKYGDPKLSGLIAPVLVDSPNVFDFVLE